MTILSPRLAYFPSKPNLQTTIDEFQVSFKQTQTSGFWLRIDEVPQELSLLIQENCHVNDYCFGKDPNTNKQVLFLHPASLKTKRFFSLFEQRWLTKDNSVAINRLLLGERPVVTSWNFRSRTFEHVGSPVVMGIVNTTPDSFSDGGDFSTTQKAIEHCLRLEDEGAGILDIGGESTRPGADFVSVDEELRRVLPVIEGLEGRVDIPISIDTTKSRVADLALQAGAEIVNDISCLRFDPDLAEVVARHDAYLILMHSRHTPREMQSAPGYRDLWGEMLTEMGEGLQKAEVAGVKKTNIALDPGIGFGKRVQDNYRILAEMDCLLFEGYPVLVGASRKSFLKELTSTEPKERLGGSLGVGAFCQTKGVHFLRVHDVQETKQLLSIMERLQQSQR